MAWKTDKGNHVSQGQMLLHTSLQLQWLLCMTVASNRLITLHIPPDLAPSDYFLFPNMKKNMAVELLSDWWWGHICSWGLFWGSGWELLYHRNPSAATSMEEVCGPQGRRCKKKKTFGQIRPLHHTALLWQKEASDESDIYCKRAKCVCHFHWSLWNIMMSHITYVLAGPDEC